MIVHVLVREDQNEHGYVDTSIVGVYGRKAMAKAAMAVQERSARNTGLVVEDDERPGGEWQVSWSVCSGRVVMPKATPRPDDE